ncbi:hypothetical protein [Aeromonas hydrophila]|uniref:hypothetical protein n=1 Tax=Aeromonas hydrophila TaxID=644 RepID=UPI0012D37AEF|nr:hypothetical protein [Aeromonas hydrophila]
MEHAVSAYAVRVFNKEVSRRADDRYHLLNKIGAYDLLELIHVFCTGRKDYTTIADSKQAYRIIIKNHDPAKRMISGWIEYGHFGMQSNIVDIVNKKVDYTKKPTNADMGLYYFLLWIPQNAAHGIAIFHTIRGDGVKTLFQKEFCDYIKTYVDRTLQMNNLTFDRVLQSWANADTKEIVALRLKDYSDIADVPVALGNVHASLSIKPQRKGKLSKLGAYLKKGSTEAILVEQLDDVCDDIKILVEMNGRKKTFRIGKKKRKGNSEIEIPDDEVNFRAGVPEFSSLNKWSLGLLNDFKDELYK